MTDKEKLQKLIKEYGGTQEKFAEFLGVAISTVANWKFRNKISPIAMNLISRKCPEVNMEWLEGTSDIYKLSDMEGTEAQRFYEGLDVLDGETIHQSFSDGLKRNILIPDIPSTQFIKVQGCSLQPTILSGDIIGIHEIKDWDNHEYRKEDVYLIMLEENERYLKHIYANEDPQYFFGYSDNASSAPLQIAKNKIHRVYQVDFYGRIINKIETKKV